MNNVPSAKLRGCGGRLAPERLAKFQQRNIVGSFKPSLSPQPAAEWSTPSRRLSAHNDRVVKDKSYAVGRATTALRLADLADRRVDRTTPDCSSRHCYAHVLTTRNPKQSCAASDHARVCAARRPPNTQHASCGRRQRHADSSCRLTSARPKAYQRGFGTFPRRFAQK